MDYGKSVFEEHAGKELLWLGADSEQEYKKNLINQYNLLDYHGWIDKPVIYKFNSKGFRCNEFNSNKPSIMFLGCSFTMGTGLPIENTWAYILASKLGLECYNLGISAGSNDTAFRLCYHYIGKLQPKYVVMLSTFNTRFETFKSNGNIIQHFLNKTTLSSDDVLYRHLLSNEANLDLNKTKNIFAIRYLCSVTNIPFIEVDVNDFPRLDLARDLGHPGRKSNEVFADTILKKITGCCV